MADATVEFLLENLKQLVLHHTRLIKGAKSQLDTLENYLMMLKAILEERSTKNRIKNKVVEALMRQIRDVVYDAEDIIDDFVIQAEENETRSFFRRTFRRWKKRHSLSTKVEDIIPRVKHVYEESMKVFPPPRNGNVSDAGMEHKEFKQTKVFRVREDNLVGFEDEAQTLISYLGEETMKLDVISIIGMPGLGKTTLAGKVFCDQKIQYEFPTRIWVSVSQEYNKKDVFFAIVSNLIDQYSKTNEFLDILRDFVEVNEEEDDVKLLKSKVEDKTDNELAQMACQFLEKIKFLIIMDDVWTIEAWTDLEVAFPKINTMGKILVTSRNEEVARQANRNRDSYKPRLLTHDESWELLQLEVFGKLECHPELEELGKTIAKQCGGVPLAIVVIGGILVKRASTTDIRAMKNNLTKVSENLKTYINEDKRMEDIIALSYNKLPYYLRLCFLSIGMFPEAFEIPVWQLSSMWIAEGLIQQRGRISLEETAQDYLEELIRRNLVMVGKISFDGKIKTCRIHDMLREFCQNEAGSEKENFFHEMKKFQGGDFEPSIAKIKKCRRLCIHPNVLSFISSKPFGPRVRSFVSFSKEEIAMHQRENISFIHLAFKLLRVFDVQPFWFTKFPYDLTRLVHLRHIVLSGDIQILPRAISKLWNLQLLIVFTICPIIEIQADIWEMIQLRHVKMNVETILPKPGKSAKECKKLQTLGMLSVESCTEDVFDRLRSLRKLGIAGQLFKLSNAKGLEKLGNLEKLTLNGLLYRPPIEGMFAVFPRPHKFPSRLRSLTLSYTYLDWSHISTLAMLDTLVVLKLKNYASVEEDWAMTGGGFQRLEVLHIENSFLCRWEASAHHFPRLRCLVLRCCGYLKEIPFGLHKNLQQLELVDVSSSAVASARKIKQAKGQQQQGETSSSSGFKLFIDPPDL